MRMQKGLDAFSHDDLWLEGAKPNSASTNRPGAGFRRRERGLAAIVGQVVPVHSLGCTVRVLDQRHHGRI